MSTHLNDDGTISIIADPDSTEVVIACTGGHGWIVQGEPFEPEVAGKSPTMRMLSPENMIQFGPHLPKALGLR